MRVADRVKASIRRTLYMPEDMESYLRSLPGPMRMRMSADTCDIQFGQTLTCLAHEVLRDEDENTRASTADTRCSLTTTDAVPSYMSAQRVAHAIYGGKQLDLLCAPLKEIGAELVQLDSGSACDMTAPVTARHAFDEWVETCKDRVFHMNSEDDMDRFVVFLEAHMDTLDVELQRRVRALYSTFKSLSSICECVDSIHILLYEYKAHMTDPCDSKCGCMRDLRDRIHAYWLRLAKKTSMAMAMAFVLLRMAAPNK
jgi:hypothetical protein